jgi:hypothetical protein
MWIVIADCYDVATNNWLLLCCDRRRPLFGAVILGYDYGCPYRDGVPSEKCRVVAPSFLEYLRRGHHGKLRWGSWCWETVIPFRLPRPPRLA